MSVIRKLQKKDWDVFVDILANAYPGFGVITDQDKEKMKRRLLQAEKYPYINCYGLFRSKKLLGGMRLFDFVMNVYSHKIMTGGLGLVAVDLIHKKEKVCKEMVEFFIDHYRTRGYSLTALYPFRPDFYKKMGFGYGTTMQQYIFQPGNLPRGDSKEHVRFLTGRDLPALKACFRRFCQTTHGMIYNCDYMLDRIFVDPAVKCVGYLQKKHLCGFVVFSFKRDPQQNWLKNDLIIHNLVWERPDAFLELMTFLHTQLDQVHRIRYGGQLEHLHWVLHDPRSTECNLMHPLGHETNTQGVGIMYKVINVKKLFTEIGGHSFGDENCTVRIDIQDTFTPQQAQSVTVRFSHGYAKIIHKGRYDFQMSLDIAEFSSLILGAVPFKSLHNYGLINISPPSFVSTAENLFFFHDKPVCTAQF
jgi:predicted acetyltransferase